MSIRIIGLDVAHLGFDELVAEHARIHIERMSSSHIWLNVSDGTYSVTLNLHAQVYRRLLVKVEGAEEVPAS